MNSNELQESYDKVAEEYVARIFHELEQKPLDRELLNRFAVEVYSLGTVCDMGCGPGHIARHLHHQGVHVLGIDLSPRMMEQARQLNPGIEFQQGNMSSLDVNDEAWGGIIAFYSIIHIPREEVIQVLPARQVWVNPDCGLKTRRWEEIQPALTNLVAAAQAVRSTHYSSVLKWRTRYSPGPPFFHMTHLLFTLLKSSSPGIRNYV